jgi:glutamate--cysteine ligase
MEKFFDREGPWGRRMMCGTASVQVCLDAGDDSESPSGYRSRWRLLHAIGPVLVAAFANSPLRDGKPTGWRSARQQVWANMDPGRTRAPADVSTDSDPRDAWASYALDAELMCVREPGSQDWTAPPGVTFRDWLRDGGSGALRPPTAEDLDYHLSTLFPPVRPRGHMEMRMIDAQRGDDWIVPAAVATALTGDERATDAAMAAAEPVWDSSPGTRDPWLRAAQCGPADARIGQASRQCFEAADAALSRLDAPTPVRRAVAAFTERYVLKDRCPADDQLDGASLNDGVRARPGNPARGHRARTDRRAAAHVTADRQRGRGRPGQTTLAADVPAGLGPRAYSQPRGAVAAARGRRP